MRSLADLVRKLSQSSAPAPSGNGEPAGERSLLDGRSAVVHMERTIGSLGSAPSGGRVLPFSSVAGLALGGIRTAAYLGDQDPLAEAGPMARAAARHLPLVAHLACRATTSHGVAIGSGHEAYHGLADTGFALLFAANVQEAADFTLVARQFTELALVPVLVAMDEDQTAGALQDLYLPDAALVKELLGSPDDSIESPTPSQTLLFGEHRRRVPRRFDLDVPSLGGALHDRASWGLAAAAESTYFSEHVPMMLAQALQRVGDRLGRPLSLATRGETDDADIVLVAQGGAVETAEAVARALRAEKRRVGVLGIRSCRPFPIEAAVEACRGARRVVVLERMVGPVGKEGPLGREMATALAHAGDAGNGAGGKMITACYGLGGMPLRARDLAGFCRERIEGAPDRVFLGIDFTTRSPEYPKRQALIDQVRRDYPEGAALGFRVDRSAEPAGVVPDGSVTVAVIRGDDAEDGDFSTVLFRVVQEVAAGRIRSRLQTRWEDWGEKYRDFAVWGDDTLLDPGEESPVDLAVFVEPKDLHESVLRRSLPLLRKGGAVLVGGRCPGEQIERIAAVAREGRELSLQMHYLPSFDDTQTRKGRNERLIGAAASIVSSLRRGEALDGKKVAAAREAMLGDSNPLGGLFRAGWKDVQRVDPQTQRGAPSVPVIRDEEAPLEVQRWKAGAAAPLDSLPRFWDQVGVLYRRGDQDSLTPDPFLASSSVPALSASFHTTGDTERTFPEYDPAGCTACGECWTHCPDGAIGAAVMSADDLIKKAMAEAKEDGRSADGLRRILAKLTKGLDAALRGSSPPATVGAALAGAFQSLMDKSPPPADQKAALEEAMEALLDVAGEMPATVADAVGSSLLSLSISPDRCKGCATCVNLCEPGALAALPSSTERKKSARPGRTAWEKVAATTPAKRRELVEGGSLGEAATLFLSREATRSFSGSDGAEQGSGARSALRLVLAAAEDYARPLIDKHVKAIAEAEKVYAEKIRGTLADALPTGDLDLLADGIAAVGGRNFDLSSLAHRMEEACDQGTVDGGALAALVDNARALAEVRARLEGSGNAGARAPHGLVIASEAVARWAAVYPHNPFVVPATVDTSAHAAELAEGLLQSMIHAVAEDVRLLRRSDELLDGRGAAADRSRGPFVWRDWTAGERELCPPLFLVFDDEAFERHGRAHLTWLLHSELPIKIIHLTSLDSTLGGRLGEVSSDSGLIALAHRGCFTLQGSIAHPDHLVHGVTHALRFGGPAFIRVHTPSPLRDGVPVDRVVEQARLAVYSRAYPLFLYDPGASEGGLSLVNLDGNPSTGEAWTNGDGRAPYTFADWAATEGRFARHFRPLEGDAPKPTPAAEYLLLPPGERKGLTPFVAAPGGGGEGVRWETGGAVIEAADEHLKIWGLLREFAGLGREALRAEHRKAVDEARETARAELTERLKGRLRAFAGLGASPAEGNGGE